MVNSEGKGVPFIHVLVVKPCDYEKYVSQWGATHVIVRLPVEMPGWSNDAETGGVGYARR